MTTTNRETEITNAIISDIGDAKLPAIRRFAAAAARAEQSEAQYLDGGPPNIDELLATGNELC